MNVVPNSLESIARRWKNNTGISDDEAMRLFLNGRNLSPEYLLTKQEFAALTNCVEAITANRKQAQGAKLVGF